MNNKTDKGDKDIYIEIARYFYKYPIALIEAKIGNLFYAPEGLFQVAMVKPCNDILISEALEDTNDN